MLGRAEPWLVGLGKVLTWDTMIRVWFVVHAAAWVHSMVLHGCRDDVADCSQLIKLGRNIHYYVINEGVLFAEDLRINKKDNIPFSV